MLTEFAQRIGTAGRVIILGSEGRGYNLVSVLYKFLYLSGDLKY